jgi:hypothetical protein
MGWHYNCVAESSLVRICPTRRHKDEIAKCPISLLHWMLGMSCETRFIRRKTQWCDELTIACSGNSCFDESKSLFDRPRKLEHVRRFACESTIHLQGQNMFVV